MGSSCQSGQSQKQLIRHRSGTLNFHPCSGSDLHGLPSQTCTCSSVWTFQWVQALQVAPHLSSSLNTLKPSVFIHCLTTSLPQPIPVHSKQLVAPKDQLSHYYLPRTSSPKSSLLGRLSFMTYLCSCRGMESRWRPPGSAIMLIPICNNACPQRSGP